MAGRFSGNRLYTIGKWWKNTHVDAIKLCSVCYSNKCGKEEDTTSPSNTSKVAIQIQNIDILTKPVEND